MRKLRYSHQVTGKSHSWEVAKGFKGGNLASSTMCLTVYIRGPQPLGLGAVPGTRLHSRRWAACRQAVLHLYLQPLPSLALVAELRLLSDQRHNKCNGLESSVPWSVDKLSSMKLIPGAKNVGDRWFIPLLLQESINQCYLLVRAVGAAGSHSISLRSLQVASMKSALGRPWPGDIPPML